MRDDAHLDTLFKALEDEFSAQGFLINDTFRDGIRDPLIIAELEKLRAVGIDDNTLGILIVSLATSSLDFEAFKTNLMQAVIVMQVLNLQSQQQLIERITDSSRSPQNDPEQSDFQSELKRRIALSIMSRLGECMELGSENVSLLIRTVLETVDLRRANDIAREIMNDVCTKIISGIDQKIEETRKTQEKSKDVAQSKENDRKHGKPPNKLKLKPKPSEPSPPQRGTYGSFRFHERFSNA